MPRIRTIKPEFWDSESIGRRLAGPDGRQARLLFIALWNHAEDHGVCRAAPALLRSVAFPYDEDVTSADVSRWLGLLEAGRFIVRYERDGSSYLWVRAFDEHQKIDRKSKTSLPEPSNQEKQSALSGFHPVASPRRALDEPSLQEGKGREGKGEEVWSASRDAADAGPSADDLPDATEDAEHVDQPAPAANGCPDCTAIVACWKHLERDKGPKKRERAPSAAEALYARLDGAREAHCQENGQPYVPEAWAASRINKEFGPIAKGTTEDVDVFLHAYLAFLEDERKGEARVPWSISLFMHGGVRAEYTTKVLRARQDAA